MFTAVELGSRRIALVSTNGKFAVVATLVATFLIGLAVARDLSKGRTLADIPIASGSYTVFLLVLLGPLIANAWKSAGATAAAHDVQRSPNFSRAALVLMGMNLLVLAAIIFGVARLG